ncbi:hypothetical protein ACFP2T_01690 [Plantactinospora solaniradicis]|uniref:Uncharacterized protein n=1 Tax=Plantactinospora solaniradicis TaxID=1723736 RepID=A0ABW1JZM3_9ACTN
MKTPWIAVSALVAGLALSACGSTEPNPSEPGGSPVTPPASAQPDPTGPTDPGPTRPAGPPSKPGTPTPRGGAPSGGTTTLSGTVQAGVEANCFLLDGYLLVGGPREVITAGARVTVTGEVRAGLMTTCQQGIPFVVQSATRG